MSGAVLAIMTLAPVVDFSIGSQTTQQVGGPGSTTFITSRVLTGTVSGGNAGWSFSWAVSGGNGLMFVPASGNPVTASIEYDLNDPVRSDIATVTLTVSRSGVVLSIAKTVSLIG